MSETTEPALEDLIGPEAAGRLSSDPALNTFFDKLVRDATLQVIYHADPTTREVHRQLVLAIDTIRYSLSEAAKYDQRKRDEDQRAKSFE